jgi:hypothetical protein
LSAGDDHTFRLWDLSSGKEIKTFVAHTDTVNSVAISPDGKTALSGSRDGTIKLWDLSSGKEIKTVVGHTNSVDSSVDSVAISPDGKTAMSSSGDALTLWDLSSGREIETFSGHIVHLLRVAFSPDGKMVLCGCGDTMQLWNFLRATQYVGFEYRGAAAKKTLQDYPDAGSLQTLGEWYAFRGKNDWAIELLEKARLGGANVSNLTLGRCYWEENQLPQGRKEFEAALAKSTDEHERFYLSLCLQAIEHPPTTQPVARVAQ